MPGIVEIGTGVTFDPETRRLLRGPQSSLSLCLLHSSSRRHEIILGDKESARKVQTGQKKKEKERDVIKRDREETRGKITDVVFTTLLLLEEKTWCGLEFLLQAWDFLVSEKCDRVIFVAFFPTQKIGWNFFDH